MSISMQETLGMDAARSSFTVGNLVEVNSRVNWDLWGPILFVSIVVGLLLLWHRHAVLYALKNNFVTRWMGNRRMREDREKKVREILSDNIQDAVDEAFLESSITAEERQWAFYQIGKLGFPDLLSRAQREKLALEEKEKEDQKKQTLAIVHVL